MLRRVVIVVIIFVVTLVGVRLVGALSQPNALDVIRAAQCTPMPCWQGIQPGKTTMDEAKAILTANTAFTVLDVSRPGDLCWYSADGPFWRNCAHPGWDANSNVV